MVKAVENACKNGKDTHMNCSFNPLISTHFYESPERIRVSFHMLFATSLTDYLDCS